MGKTDTLRNRAEAILKSSKQPFSKVPYKNWDIPQRIKYLYWRLKTNAAYFVVNDQKMSIEKISAKLTSAYKLIGIGKEHFQKGSILKEYDVPPAIYLEYLEEDKTVEDLPQDIYVEYFLLAMLDLIKFENVMESLASNIACEGQGTDSLLIKATGLLLDAQVALELGNSGYSKCLGEVNSQRLYLNSKRLSIVLKEYGAGINAEFRRQKSYQIKREGWLPIILKVQERVDQGRGVSDSCRFVLKDFHKLTGDEKKDTNKQKALRTQYYKWKKQPDEYL